MVKGSANNYFGSITVLNGKRPSSVLNGKSTFLNCLQTKTGKIWCEQTYSQGTSSLQISSIFVGKLLRKVDLPCRRGNSRGTNSKANQYHLSKSHRFFWINNFSSQMIYSLALKRKNVELSETSRQSKLCWLLRSLHFEIWSLIKALLESF